MKSVLLLNSSLNGESGNSSKLSRQFISQWQSKEQLDIVERDLSGDNLSHLAGAEMQAWMTAPDQRSEAQHQLAAISDILIAELQASDVIVVGMPMYNFGVPSVFKSWIDRVARAGRTFKYTETGPVGLLQDKQVYVLAARGGMYAGTVKDSQSQYLKDVFAFLGMTTVEFVYVEGLAMGEEAATSAWQKGNEKIIELIEKQAA
jgi:FMN-dependent NADH-azoreductase